jgi:UDPglucose 6-dehydrogenase
MSYDSRIGKNYLNAGIGYGGSCLPKDTKALAAIAGDNGYNLETVKAAIRVNEAQKTRLLKMASERFPSLKGMKTAILGLSYKPGTDDLREAPSLENVSFLVSQGANIHAYDPAAEGNFKNKFPHEVVYVNTPEEALADAEVCFIFTQWQQIREISPKVYKSLMRNPVIYDGRNIYDPEDMKAAGVEYHSIGRKFL